MKQKERIMRNNYELCITNYALICALLHRNQHPIKK